MKIYRFMSLDEFKDYLEGKRIAGRFVKGKACFVEKRIPSREKEESINQLTDFVTLNFEKDNFEEQMTELDKLIAPIFKTGSFEGELKELKYLTLEDFMSKVRKDATAEVLVEFETKDGCDHLCKKVIMAYENYLIEEIQLDGYSLNELDCLSYKIDLRNGFSNGVRFDTIPKKQFKDPQQALLDIEEAKAKKTREAFCDRIKIDVSTQSVTSKWRCPFSEIDSDIRDIVSLLFENDMKPYMSCSGSYKDHNNKGVWPQCGCIEMLDSELARELMAKLIRDKRFKCTIIKEGERIFYDNTLPLGLRLVISFENICGNIQTELLGILQAVVKGEKAEPDDKDMVDRVCEFINSFPVPTNDDKSTNFKINGNRIEFSFNDEMVKEGEEDKDNYSIEIFDTRDFESYIKTIKPPVEDFIQNKKGCKIFASDFISAYRTLKHIVMNYDTLKPIVTPKEVLPTQKRVDRFLSETMRKFDTAKATFESMSIPPGTTTDFSLFDKLIHRDIR